MPRSTETPTRLTGLPGAQPSTPGALAARRHPIGFLAHYVARHPIGHAIVLVSVVAAVLCSVSTQYGMKRLIDVIAAGPNAAEPAAQGVWSAFLLLCALIAADNLLWRVGGWAAARTFVAVTGDVRRDMFAHLSGHSPGLLRRAAARRAGRTDQRHRQRRLHGGEHRLLERAAAQRRGAVRDRLHRLGQSADGRRAGGPGARRSAR